MGLGVGHPWDPSKWRVWYQHWIEGNCDQFVEAVSTWGDSLYLVTEEMESYPGVLNQRVKGLEFSLGWPKSSFEFFHKISQKNTNEPFGQPSIVSQSPLKNFDCLFPDVRN